MLQTMNIYCQYRVTINYTSQQRFHNMYNTTVMHVSLQHYLNLII